ncbi:MAG: sulfatase-like hydrolase/transferase [Candidatus Hodarchaeota archaeon]
MTSKPMNILFIFSDQQHKFSLGSMGTTDIKTPNLDKLAREGVLFRNAYSNCPICTPFRINLFTGMYASQTGAFGNGARIPEGCTSLAKALNDGGYYTSYIGKWHIGATGNRPIPEDLRGDFKDFIGYQCYNGFYKDVVFYDEQGEAHEFNKHRTDVATDLAIERLEKIADKPFAMFVSYQSPHYPVQPAPEYDEMYKGVKIKRRPNSQEVDPYVATHSPRSPRPPDTCPDFQRYGNNLDEYLRLYYALVTQIDANVGRLIDALERLGVADNTVVIFTSDHGDMQGSHGLKNKTKPHEESAGIPFIIKVPGGAEGLVTDALVSGIDCYPSCLDYTGIPIPDGLPGSSFAPMTRSEPQEWDRPVFSEMRDWKMIRKGDIKLVTRGPKHVPDLLFDLEKDPYEMNNVVENEAYTSKLESLREELIDHFRNFATASWLGSMVKNHVKGSEKSGNGIVFTSIPSTSTASFIGFREGDIVVQVGDTRIPDVSAFLKGMDEAEDQDDTMITIIRDNEEQEIEL